MDLKRIIEIIKSGGIGVFPTDTLYGLVGMAFDRQTVERIYRVKKRPENKPFIILLDNIEALAKFGIKVDTKMRSELNRLWPNPVTILFDVSDKEYGYLTKGTGKIAFRVPKEESIQKVLAETGPLVAPSANISDHKPAENIEQAKEYFGDLVDFYYGNEILKSLPSTIIEFKNNKPFVIREGKYKVKT